MNLYFVSCYLCHFEELCHPVHPDEELLVQVQGVPGLLLAHVKILLQQVDHSIIVASKKSDQISEEKHKARIDDPIIQILKLKKNLC